MAQQREINLIKLHLEVSKENISRSQLRLLYLSLRTGILHRYSRYNSISDKKYPIPITTLLNMCNIYKMGNAYYIGYIYDQYIAEEKEIYKNILDLEYGVTGAEMRVVRYVLEDCVRKFKGGEYER